MTSETRRPVYFNPAASSWRTPSYPQANLDAVVSFHRNLPNYHPTPLVSIEAFAQELGVEAVYVKDESNRFDLPSFKNLGVSWAVYRAVIRELNLAPGIDLAGIEAALASHSRSLRLFAGTEGNHGRAVARMGSLLSIPAEIYVPAGIHPSTVELIQSEGAVVVVSLGDYDLAMKQASDAAAQSGGLLVQDCGLELYEEIPQVSLACLALREIDH